MGLLMPCSSFYWEEHSTLGGYGSSCGYAYIAQATYKKNLCVLGINGVIIDTST